MNFFSLFFKMDTDTLCTLCNQSLQNESEDIVKVHEKGLNSFICKSESKNDEKWKLWKGKTSVEFHEKCRKRYSASLSTANKKIKMIKHPEQEPPLHLALDTSILVDFKFDTLCFFCCKSLDPYRKKISCIQEMQTLNKLICAANSSYEEIGTNVLNRLRGISLDIQKPKYHVNCYKIFVDNNSIPTTSAQEMSFGDTEEMLDDPYYLTDDQETDFMQSICIVSLKKVESFSF